MKKIILLLTLLFTMSSFAQIDYPRIETDSLGQQVVIMTIEQAQKIDNKLELLKLFENLNSQINDYEIVCLKVINEKEEIIAKQDILINNLRYLNLNKDSQIENLQKQINNYKLKEENYKKELENKDKEIKLHKDKIKKQRNRMILGGSLGGAIIGGLVYLVVVLAK
jgi:peptidoglycan hydrolase CwlO-like protein